MSISIRCQPVSTLGVSRPAMTALFEPVLAMVEAVLAMMVLAMAVQFVIAIEVVIVASSIMASLALVADWLGSAGRCCGAHSLDRSSPARRE